MVAMAFCRRAADAVMGSRPAAGTTAVLMLALLAFDATAFEGNQQREG